MGIFFARKFLSAAIAALGIRCLRFTNQEADAHLDAVIERIQVPRVGWAERSKTQHQKGFRWVTLALIQPTTE